MTLSTALETALNRIEDMLSDDDGQAFKEARKFLPVGRDTLAALRSMPAEPVAWAEKAMELATDFGVCSLRLGSYERADVVFNAQKASWQTIDLRAKREDARERLRQHLFATPPTEAKPAKDAVDAAIPLDKDEVAQLIAEHLGDTYHCTRVWEAWNVGTMSQDDFEPVDESETPTEIADAIIDAIRAARAPADSVLEDAADPLQGAANWLAEAHGQFCVAVLQGCLMIGYNRAKRLHDAAIAARKQGGAT